MKEYHCAIDIGSSLCHVIIGRFLEGNKVEILGTGSVPSQGVKTASIINIEAIAQNIAEAVREAELMSGIGIEAAMTNISGKHLHSDNSRSVVAISNPERIVKSKDVMRVIEGTQNLRIHAEQEILHVLSRQFSLDDQRGIRDPLGMSGVRLEAEVHIVTVSHTALSNLHKALSTCGIEPQASVMNSLACAEALLHPEEKELGIAVVDIGGSITDIILYTEGGICFSATVPLGGMHITQDLAIGLKVPVEAAEFIKKNYGSATAALVDPMEKIELPSAGGRPPRQTLRKNVAEIMEARLREIFEHVDKELIKSDCKNMLTGGVVLCGGTSLIEGMEELAEDSLALSAVVRSPQNVEGFVDRIRSPEFAVGVGLLHYMRRMAARKGPEDNPSINVKGILGRLRSWLVENV